MYTCRYMLGMTAADTGTLMTVFSKHSYTQFRGFHIDVQAWSSMCDTLPVTNKQSSI